jgi:hypothetical protein
MISVSFGILSLRRLLPEWVPSPGRLSAYRSETRRFRATVIFTGLR